MSEISNGKKKVYKQKCFSLSQLRRGSLSNLIFMEVYKKTIYRGELPKRGELGQFLGLRGGLAEKEGLVFLMGGLIPQCTLCHGRKKNNADKDNLNRPVDEIETNQNWI